jgi:transcriptional regulator with XRE-family HTH domain
MFEFRISGARLARETGVNQSQISEFKNGGDSVSVANLQKIIHALQEDQRAYYLALVGDLPVEENPDRQRSTKAKNGSAI